VPDFSNNTALQDLRLYNNKLTGELYEILTEVHTSESKLDLFILGNIGDFSSNVNLTHLILAQNGLAHREVLPIVKCCPFCSVAHREVLPIVKCCPS
jgi:hypothetical protein